MRPYLFIVLGLFIATVQPPVQAGEEEKEVSAAMKELFPDMNVTAVRESEVPGLYEVMSGTEVFYVTGDGRYLLRGDLFNLEQRRNLTEEKRAAERIEVLENIPESQYIEFAPKNPEHFIYVFTDVTCGYCRKLHFDVPELNKKGLGVRYLAFPRQGPESSAYRQMVSVWCADDRNAALTAAKRGEMVEPASCPNPVGDHFDLGRRIGVRGTPAIYMENGKEIPGYKPPEALISLVNGDS